MTWLKVSAALLLTLTALAAGLVWYGQRTWQRSTQMLVDQMMRGRVPLAVTHYDPKELVGLPPVVQRFFRAALTDGMPIVTSVSISHTGTFNMGESKDNWRAFSSTQAVSTNARGFVWDGRVSMMPGIDVYVHDAYVNGEGLLHPAVIGLFTLTELRGRGDVAEGELMRFFAETAWYPTALLPSQGVRWSPVDDNTADATISDGTIKQTLRFRFSADGLIESGRAQARARTVGKALIPTPWEGRWSGYETTNGMRVPMKGEVAWMLPEGEHPYWRGTVTSLRYEFAH